MFGGRATTAVCAVSGIWRFARAVQPRSHELHVPPAGKGASNAFFLPKEHQGLRRDEDWYDVTEE